MKGLIYKDFCLSRKKLFLATILYFYGMIIGILFRLSMIYGNMRLILNEKEQFYLTDTFSYYTLIYLPFPLFLLAVNTIFNDCIFHDYKVKWNIFYDSLPVKQSDIIISRYLIIIINTLFTFVFSTINAVIISHLSNRNFNLDIIKNFLIISIFFFLVNVLYMILAYKYRQKNIVTAILILPAVIIYVSFSILIMRNMEKYSDELKFFVNDMFTKFSEIRNTILPLSILILLFISFWGYIISLKILKRGEN